MQSPPAARTLGKTDLEGQPRSFMRNFTFKMKLSVPTVVVCVVSVLGTLAATGGLAQPPSGHREGVPTPGQIAAKPSPSPTRTQLRKPTPTPLESLTPDEILERTEGTLRANPDPPYIYYKMHEVFVHHGRSYDFDYQIWYRNDGKGLMQNVVTRRDGSHEQFFGYPFPSAPDNNILLYATPAPVTTPPPPAGSPQPGVTAPIIAAQHVVGDRYYLVSLAGLENDDGHQVYHLLLRPLADPQKHPWTDLWVDTQSYEVWKAHADATGRAGPLTGRAVVDVQFAPIGNFWVVKQASADAQGRIAIFSDSGHYEYYFSDFGFPNTLPDWYFDEAAFRQHRPS